MYDPVTCRTARYETFNPRSVAPYSKSACDKMETPWIYDAPSDSGTGDSGSDLGADPLDLNIDDDDEFEDTVW